MEAGVCTHNLMNRSSVYQYVDWMCRESMGRRCDGSMGTSSIEIRGIKCVGLVPPEGEEAVSPVVTIDFNGATKTTEGKENDCNPEYDEVLVFDAHGKTITPADVLIVRVENLQGLKDGDNLLGVGSVSIKELSQPGTTVAQYSVQLNHRDGHQTTAKVKFRVEYIAVMAEIPEDNLNDIVINEPGAVPGEKKKLPAHVQISEEIGTDHLTPGGCESGADSDNDQLSSVEADDYDSEEFEEAVDTLSRKHNLPDKPTFFQVRIKVIKASNLPGSNIDPSVRVTVGTQKKQTKAIKSSTKPFFNETFFFNFNMRPNEMFDHVLTFEAYNTRGVLTCTLLGSFVCDVGMVYFQDDHAVVKKWILMSANDDSNDATAGAAAGFVQITAIVLGPGDELPNKVKADVDSDDTDDIESNCWMPLGVRLQPATFLFKVYRAEDLPHKSHKKEKKEGEGVLRRSFRQNKKDIKCDSYCKFIFAGKKGKTRVKRHTFNPEFNEEVSVPFRFPSMCETLKMQLLDWNRVRMDNVIGNNLLSLSEISSLGNKDFLPSFGPCFINFYGTSDSGNNHRLSLATQQIGSTMNKVQSGDDYKGRVLVEITTKLGKQTSKTKRSLETRELLRIKPYLERKKYKLFTTFLNANLMSHKDSDIRFETSVGNYGSTKDEDGDIDSSITPVTDTKHDGAGYHYLPWKETKPCCVVECHWEDISFRLDPMNMLRNIAQRLERNINVLELAIKLNIKLKAQESEIALLIIRILDHFIGDCNNPLPTFTEKTPGSTNLDLKVQEIRTKGLEELAAEATSYRENATDIHSALGVLKEFLIKLKTLCTEPQNSLPDVVISMVVGNKRVAYYRMPSEDVLYSKNQFCKGMYCGKQQNVILKYIGKKEDDLEEHPDLPASLNIFTWLGLEEDQADFINNKNLEGKYAVYAETYENQMKVPMVGWTSDGCPRPAYSNADGDIQLKKGDFEPPQGWAWDEGTQGEWFIDPEVEHEESSHDEGCPEFTVDIIEHEIRAYDGSWRLADEPYTNEKGDPMQHKDEIILPQDWTDWSVDIKKTTDEQGWEYKRNTQERDWSSSMKHYHMNRRRRLQRKRVFKTNEIKKIDGDVKDDIGWSFTSSFGKKFHAGDRKKDLVRRRKWKRKMIVSELSAPPAFTIPTKDKKTVTLTPRMVLVHDKSHQWQMRAYIYQAKNLRAMEDDGMSDPYALVTFDNQTQETYTVKKTLCPEWDQTLVFENVTLYGQPSTFAENPPFVCINFYDKHMIGKDEFLGRCLIQPTVRLNGPKGPSARLLWHPIKRGSRECGEVLATFELFLNEGADLPFTPPTKDNRYIVPAGIRPVIVRTGVEVLCWGVRNLKKHQLANCTSPSVSIQIGNQVIKSDKIKNTKKNPNFIKNSYFREMYLPKEPIYMPAINIIVRDHRSFGRKPIIGTHVITNFNLDKPPKDEISIINVSNDTGDDRKLTMSSFAIEIEDIAREEIEETEQEGDEEVHLDWWSKYYASVGEEKKCGTYLGDGHKTIQVFRTELEEVEAFSGFTDFAITYPLLRGKGNEEEDGKIAGEFKGAFKIYPLPVNHLEKTSKLGYFSHKRFKAKQPEHFMVRVYITRGIGLRPRNSNGKSDPYVTVKLGSKKFSTKERYIPNELNPYFGEFFEFKCQIPITKDLKIKVMDHDLIGRDGLIGKTVIDLENRVLTKARATVGLPPTYYRSGPYKWRDVRTPKELLEDFSFGKPKYISETRVIFNGNTFDLEDFENPIEHSSFLGPYDERLALHVLNNEEFNGMRLVPEHVETRCLLNPMEPGMDQGQLEMFVDIFRLPGQGGPLPGPPINITTRKPKSYELRVIVWNTADVELVDKSITGEDMSDIYVKAWVDGYKKKSMKTDTHYRSLNGDGNFNWRMMFPFQYLPEESVMIIEKKEHFWSVDKTRRSIPPKITVQVWDQDFFSPNDFIGSLEVNLNKLPFPKKTKEDCTITMLNDHQNFIDLFKTKVCKGWWIMTGKDKKKGFLVEKGKVEMTMEILTKYEADEKQCGKGREEPNMNPILEQPDRPESSFLWYRNLKKAMLYVIWKRYKCLLVLLVITVLLILGAIIFMYDVLGYSAKKMLNV